VFQRPHLIASLAFCAGLIACSSNNSGTTPPTTSAAGTGGNATQTPLPCAVDELVKSQCQTCHTDPPKFGAPMPLVSYEDFQAPAKSNNAVTVAQMAVVRLKDDAKPMPQPPNPRPNAEQLSMFEQWVNSGAPARTADDTSCVSGQGGAAGASGAAGAAGNAGGAGGSAGAAGAAGGTTACVPDIIIAPTAKWEMPQDKEDVYTCYGFDVQGSMSKRQITSIIPKIDNDKIVHHILLLQASSSQPSVPTKCGATPPLDWKLLYGWAPGAPPLVMPQEAGFPVDAGKTSHYVLQIHYSNLNHLAGETDGTGMELCSTDQLRPNDADVMAIGSVDFKIPAHTKTTLNCDMDLSSLPLVSGIFPVHVLQTWPHMHLLGTALSSEVVHADGSKESLGNSPNYSFYNQITYPVDVTIQPTDHVMTSCTWQNTSNQDVNFGESTTEEMCFNFLTYYPRIQFSQWNWLYPSYLAKCQATQ
jgi:hypothetical protein